MGRWLREESRFFCPAKWASNDVEPGKDCRRSRFSLAGGGPGGYWVSAEHGDTSVTTRECCAGIYSNCWAAAAQHKSLQAIGLLLRIQELTVCRFSDNPGVTEANSRVPQRVGKARSKPQQVRGGYCRRQSAGEGLRIMRQRRDVDDTELFPGVYKA